MGFRTHTQPLLLAVLCCCFSNSVPARAEIPPPPNPALLSLAQQFVERVSKKFDEADRAMNLSGINAPIRLPDGEMLLFNIALPKDIVLENIITTQVQRGTLLLSLRDFVAALELPITFDGDHAEGWYIRENKEFRLDGIARSVKTDRGIFPFSDNVLMQDGDYMVPVAELGTWFGFTMTPKLSQLQIDLKSETPLPIEDKMVRLARKFSDRRQQAPELPFKADEPKALEVPFVDVTTQTAYSKSGTGGPATTNRTATIATNGDFAYGTLTTQTVLNDDDILSSTRATYKRESLEPKLLGPLKARKYELGDINPTSQPLTDSPDAGLGVHITNADPRRAILDATTGISGNALPGWDVELYRGNQLLDVQEVGDDGRYNFDKVDLFSSDNNFRIMLYGPQGEVREESIYVPVNTNRLSQRGSAYDVTLTMDETQTYRAQSFDTQDAGAPRLNAQYEMPFGEASVAKLGLEAGQQDGKAEAIAHGGISTTFAQTLINANTAVDEQGEAAAELVARRNLGEHKLRNTLQVATENFDRDDDDLGSTEVFSERFSVDGPFPLNIGGRPRYNLGLGYELDNDGDDRTISTVGFSTGFGRLSFSQQFNYTLDNQTELDSVTTLNGSIGRTRVRLASEYEIKPEKALQNLRANVQRSLGEDVNIDVGISRDMQARLTEGIAQVNWQAGHALISPSISYNSDGDVRALLNTRFGMARNPQSGGIMMFDRPIAMNGGLSVFVFLDKNGNGTQDDGEDPIEKAMIAAPQTGGRQATDADGYAFFTGLEKYRLTDVYIEPDFLQDPYWLPASRGVSILPREGHVAQLVFPVLMAGEVEGTLYARLQDGGTAIAHDMSVGLYKADGTLVVNTMSGDDGYYLLSPVPPGDYFMMIGNATGRNAAFVRPAPIPIAIGYDGPVISGKDIYMDAGTDDAPVSILASMDTLTKDEPGLPVKNLSGATVVLNLGTYKSRLLMGLVWYKARLMTGDAMDGLETLVAPNDSYASVQTGLHTLRIGSPGLDFTAARQSCGRLNASGIKCIIEILPGGLQVAGI